MRIALGILCLVLCSTASAIEEVNKLVVSGDSVIHKSADRVSMEIGVVTHDASVEGAAKANGDKMNRVLDALKTVGILENEIQTGKFNMIPQYAPVPKNPPLDWRPAITGYEVRNTLSIHTGRLELAGPVIDSATQEGANIVQEISFSVQDAQEAKGEAIAQAVRQAKAYAEAAAQEAGIRLGSILELTVNPSDIRPVLFHAARLAVPAPGTPITPGDVEITASVSIVYEIRQH